jgi:predicted nucleic acid-binding protein
VIVVDASVMIEVLLNTDDGIAIADRLLTAAKRLTLSASPGV